MEVDRIQYLYPEPKHESYSSTTHYNLRYKRKHSYFKITWTLIFSFLESPLCSFLMPTIAFIIICWCYLKRVDSSVASESADIDPYAIDSLIDTILEALSSRIVPPKFWCKHMPPNVGIKIILFQNFYLPVYHIATVLFGDKRVTPDFSAHLISPSFPSKS